LNEVKDLDDDIETLHYVQGGKDLVLLEYLGSLRVDSYLVIPLFRLSFDRRMRKFTLEELKRFNGEAGSPAYVAFEGLVYDVSNSFLWKKGKHQVIHSAGVDYTGGFQQAPHGPEFLSRFPIVGSLINKS
jgi:predicted heme/steroid binding protein